MRISVTMIALLAFGLAALLSILVAVSTVERIEKASRIAVAEKLVAHDAAWASVTVDGLRLILAGTAPTEAKRFQALSLAGEVVDAHRVIDAMDVQAVADLTPPEFNVEILRNDSGISVIGLIPLQSDRKALFSALGDISEGVKVTDLVETADFPLPEQWDVSLAYALEALSMLPRSKISVLPGAVTVTAVTESIEIRSRLQDKLLNSAPPRLDLMLDLSAPRPVITPFTLRYLIEDGRGRFDACSADSEITSERILRAAEAAGLSEDANCTVGLGQPSASWGTAVETAIGALAELGEGSVTFSDADVTLIAAKGTPPALFERVSAELDADLPDLFSLHSVLPEPTEDATDGATAVPLEFSATLSPEGLVQLRGRVSDELFRMATESYAHSRFGMGNVYSATTLDPTLPSGWPVRVLAGLEAMSLLAHGQVVVQSDQVSVRGATGQQNAKAEISRILSDKLGEAQSFTIDVNYIEKLDPLASIPTPEECVASINAILEANKISFDPGSADISADASDVLKELSDKARECEHVAMEIGGHTDSQGRETMNQSLSQARADAVLNALLARRVLTSKFSAKGYGETQPIADNNTEEGREANRRITFTLLPDDEDADQSAQTEVPNEQN